MVEKLGTGVAMVEMLGAGEEKPTMSPILAPWTPDTGFGAATWVIAAVEMVWTGG